MDFDDLFAMTPVNRLAGRVTAGSSTCYEPKKKVTATESETPFPLRHLDYQVKNSQDFVDLTGVKFGRLTVIGMHLNLNGRWVCRCTCGRYVVRRKKAIQNSENSGDRCSLCQHLAYLKREDYFRRNGIWLDSRGL
jgi:hypothetical protein